MDYAQRPQEIWLHFRKKRLDPLRRSQPFPVLLQGFAIRRFPQEFGRWPDYDYRDCHPAELFLVHVFCAVVGLGRIENNRCLIHNGLIPHPLDMNDFPHRDTVRTFLLRSGVDSLSLDATTLGGQPPELMKKSLGRPKLLLGCCAYCKYLKKYSTV